MTAAIAAAHPPTERAAARGAAAVRLWLWILAALVVAMVAVGGATRLTGSGLSITEWKPVTGAVPPLSAEAWAAEFERYRQTPQYELLNRGMSLAEFKAIYAWEWGHRQLGRLIGLAFFVPVGLVLVSRSRQRTPGPCAPGSRGPRRAAGGRGLDHGGVRARAGHGRRGAGQADAAPPPRERHPGRPRLDRHRLERAAGRDGRAVAGERGGSLAPAALLALVFLQIALGGLVAGSKAGWTYNTWPLMDGSLVPPASALFAGATWAENLFGNVALIQWNHRLGAYLLVGLAVWQAFALRRACPGEPATRRGGALAGLILAQAALGILTLVLVVPLWAGLAHQIMAMAVLAMAVVHLRLSRAPAYTDRTAPPSTRTRLPVT